MRLSKARKEIVTAVMKDTIVAAAGSVLEEHGVGGVTMDRVATTAGLTAGSLYNYFRNKDELLQFVFARFVEPFFQTIDGICAADAPTPEKLLRILRAARDAAIKHKGILRLLFGKEQGLQLRKDTRPRFLRIVTELFEQGIREGAYRPHKAEYSARLFLGCLGELFELQAGGAADEEVTEFADMIIEAVRDAVIVKA